MTSCYKRICLFVIFVLLLSDIVSADNSCDLYFFKGAFVDYKACKIYLEKASDTQKYVSGLYTEGDIRFKCLVDGIRAGNERFISLAFLIRSYSDGAMLEDINIAIGSTFVQKTHYVLTAFVQYKLNEASLKSILLNTGENLVDNIPGQVNELDRRIAALDRISNTKLSGIKKRCKKILEDEKTFLIKSCRK